MVLMAVAAGLLPLAIIQHKFSFGWTSYTPVTTQPTSIVIPASWCLLLALIATLTLWLIECIIRRRQHAPQRR